MGIKEDIPKNGHQKQNNQMIHLNHIIVIVIIMADTTIEDMMTKKNKKIMTMKMVKNMVKLKRILICKIEHLIT